MSVKLNEDQSVQRAMRWPETFTGDDIRELRDQIAFGDVDFSELEMAS